MRMRADDEQNTLVPREDLWLWSRAALQLAGLGCNRDLRARAGRGHFPHYVLCEQPPGRLRGGDRRPDCAADFRGLVEKQCPMALAMG